VDSVLLTISPNEKRAEKDEQSTEVQVGSRDVMPTFSSYEAWMKSFCPTEGEAKVDDILIQKQNAESSGKAKAHPLHSTSDSAHLAPNSVRLCVTNLTKRSSPKTRTDRVLTVSPSTLIADVLHSLHSEGGENYFYFLRIDQRT
jgi:hypothetical protein